MPGVVRGIPGANIDGAGSLAWRASASFSANGQRPRDNNYMLDGVDNNETWLQTVVLFPSVDALDEFKLQTSTYSAEFGRSLGGVVNLQIKSGTNAMHGSGFEFLRNDAFDANNFFNNRAGRAKPDFSQHQFGGTIGGPIVKDKTFFFFDYQGYRVNQGATLPVDGAVGEDARGRLLGAQPGHLRSDHAPAVPGQRHPAEPLGSGGEEHPQPADSRAEHRRHAQRHRPDHQQLPDQPDARRGRTTRSTSRSITSLTANNRFFGALQLREDAPRPAGDAAARRRRVHLRRRRRQHQGAGVCVQRHAHVQLELAERVPLRLELDQVLHDADRLRHEPGAGGRASRASTWATTTSAMSQIMFNNGGMRNLGANGNQPLITNQNDFQIFDNVTRVAGKHTMKAGGSYTHRSREILNADTIVGRFDFNQNLTSSCAGITSGCTPAANTGFDFASFLLGYASNASRTLFDSGHLHRAAAGIRRLLPGRHPR